MLLKTRAPDWGHSVLHAMPQKRKPKSVYGTNTHPALIHLYSQAGCSHTHAVLPVGPPADDRQAGSAEGAASPLTHSSPSGSRDQGKDVPALNSATAPSAQAPAQAASAPCAPQVCGQKRPRLGQCQTPDVTKDRPPWLPDESLPPPPTVPEGQPAHAPLQAPSRSAADAAIRQPQVSQMTSCLHLVHCGGLTPLVQTMLSGNKHALLCCSLDGQGRTEMDCASLLACALTFLCS